MDGFDDSGTPLVSGIPRGDDKYQRQSERLKPVIRGRAWPRK